MSSSAHSTTETERFVAGYVSRRLPGPGPGPGGHRHSHSRSCSASDKLLRSKGTAIAERHTATDGGGIWGKRFAVLQGTQLCLYSDAKCQEERGQACLRGCVVRVLRSAVPHSPIDATIHTA